jgi:hypothetical protein
VKKSLIALVTGLVLLTVAMPAFAYHHHHHHHHHHHSHAVQQAR